MVGLGSVTQLSVVGLMAAGAHAVAVGTRTLGSRDVDTVTMETTAWGAACTNRNLTIPIQRTSAQVFTNESYGHDVFFALTGKEILMDGTYIISTRQCVPANSTKHADTIQVLAHGATYTKHMWDFPYQPERYSWTRKFNVEGYTTLTFDLLGAGNSSRPNALHEVQTQAHVETMKQVVERLRAGLIDGKQWKKIIFIGFSIGASIANSLATQYPTYADQTILLGLSWFHDYVYPALLLMMRDQANRINPARWGNLPDFYTTMPSLAARDFSHLYGAYDPAVTEVDYKDLDADTLGEAVSFTFHATYAPYYTNPVFLALGNNDVTFCGPTCEDHHLEVYNRFPNASDHFAKAYPNTGHNILLHYSGADMMNDVMAFVNKHDGDSRAV